MNTVIYLMRHAHIDSQDCMVGRKDFPLSDFGIRQCLFWKEYFKDINFNKIYTSSLQRTIQTAHIITQNTNNAVIHGLNEVSLGIWEGMKKKKAKEEYKEEWNKRGEDFFLNAPPQGENFNQVEKRVLPAFQAIYTEIKESLFKAHNKELHIEKTSNYLIVSHQLVNRIILSNLLAIKKEDIFTIKQDFACVNKLILNNKKEKADFIESINCEITF